MKKIRQAVADNAEYIREGVIKAYINLAEIDKIGCLWRSVN